MFVELLMRWRRAATSAWSSGWLKALLGGVLGWWLMAGLSHLRDDHLLLHALAQIEVQRQQTAQTQVQSPTEP